MSEIYFQSGSDFVECIKWCTDTDKDSLPAGSPKTFVYFQQTTAESAVAIAYGKGDTWLSRSCNCTGVIGTTYLLKGSDISSRIGTQEVFKNYALIMSATKLKKAKLQSISEVDSKNGDYGVTQVDVYPGDQAAFVLPDTTWVKVATILEGRKFRQFSKLNQDLSALNKNTSGNESPPCFLRFQDKVLSIASGEKSGSLTGNNLIVTEIPVLCTQPLRVAIRGRLLQKISGTFTESNAVIEIYVDNLEDPSRIKFKGDLASVDTPVIDLDNCRALSEGAMAYFYGEKLKNYQETCSRTFDTDKLEGFVGLQTPSKGRSPDILLNMEGNKMIISKREEGSKGEKSKVTTWDLSGTGEWKPYIVKHDLMMQSLETINKHIAACIDETQREYVATDFDDQGPPTEFNVVELVQAVVKVLKRNTHVLFFRNPTYTTCRIMLIATAINDEE